MPRGGNDPARGLLTDDAGNAQFAAGIQSQYGEFQNAEQLIVAHQGMADQALRRALLTPTDTEATAELDQEAAEGKFELEEGQKLVDYAVHGNALVGVIDTNGRYDKVVTAANDRYEEPALTPADQAARAQAEHDVAIQRESAKLRQEMELKLEEVKQDLQAEQAEAMAKFAEEQNKELESKQEDAAAEAESSDTSSSSKSTAKAKS